MPGLSAALNRVQNSTVTAGAPFRLSASTVENSRCRPFIDAVSPTVTFASASSVLPFPDASVKPFAPNGQKATVRA